LAFLLFSVPAYPSSIQEEGKNWKVDLQVKYLYDDNLTTSPRDPAMYVVKRMWTKVGNWLEIYY